ncbi:hypothetical protein [Vitiosangium sp. GDMCC 1.1324]|uniref:hypothetical protein n=1 Tax=Vitiosangium sp. (strain GDMCC 1.1324) TaxID=2138576 RepID=UPI000D3346D2|nr:hypothetical protein [Vitiosangium sp. GDMCC 1.1324]PTL83016.1 hypothetical protein DAT35_13415 [Vitiosangium sp. GDMCC 1.1324]
MRAALLVAWALWAAPAAARAQEDVPEATRPERLYINSGVLMGSSRVVGMGGAYVGIAEGVAGFANNMAALAQRSPGLDKDWDVGFTLSWLDLPLAKAKGKDLDNDGLADDAPQTLQLLGAIMLQYRNVGLGFSMRNYQVGYCNTAHCDPSDLIRVSLVQSALAGAVSLGRDDFILGFGIYSAQAIFSHKPEGNWNYGNTGIALDILYRPHGRSYRVGMSVRPEVVGEWRRDTGQVPFIAGRQLYSAVVSPAVLSLGASFRLGEGAERYNRLSPAARQQMLEGAHFAEVPAEDDVNALAGRWLISAQADFISRVENAVSMHSFTAITEPEKVGGSAMIQPRLGVEHETWPGRLRTRLGTFIEPSPFEGQLPRPHLTGGFELFLFRYMDDWALTASFDVSRRYSNFGVSVGFWR